MTTIEHLERIKAKCEELIAKCPPCESTAGWRSTIAAIDYLLHYASDQMEEEDTANEIIAAWPEELL